VKLGMNMLLWSTDVSGPEYDVTFAMLKGAGFDGVEIPIFDREIDKYAELGRRLDDIGLERIAVGARSADDNPISADPAVRAEAAAATRANLDSAAALGATIICGPLAAPLGVFSGAPPTAEEKALSVACLRDVAPYAEERGVTIAVEYLSRFEMYLTNTAADLAALVREVDHPYIRMMYDTFHANIEEKSPRAALLECRDVLAHVHLSESDRSTPGTGQVAWEETFAALHEIGYDGWVAIEAFSGSLPELAAATKIWRRMYESEEQLARDGAAFIRSGLAF
jgi:D-psicose/D-tagatose/L-ribulose 3-epimerase